MTFPKIAIFMATILVAAIFAIPAHARMDVSIPKNVF